MRMQILLAVALPALLLVPSTVTGQEVGDAVTFTGCLAQEEDDGVVEYLLQGVDPEATEATEIELIPAEEIDLAPHVGHTVQITGVAVADDDEDGHAEEEHEEEHEDEEHELHIRVTGMEHVSASCEGG